ncbi:hypothetical protein [Mesobacillus subterraneus]|uniref:Uncharacterized protein n=1 Tax=Mesobacillus subterraneus TaxID=285983 RepID=A0A427TWA4_9BACI|nr:hypothetical protein [Mesobacillus subterraneus]RSD28616.1 hypothetical protein EJA10_03295 [Mesobacillus subterraneus]
MDLLPYYLVTLLIITAVSYFLFLVIKKLRFRKLLSGFFVYLLGSFIISGILIYAYFFSNGAYVNRGIAGAYITVLFVLIGNGIAFGLTHFLGVKKYQTFSGMFYISLPLTGLLSIAAFLMIATIFNL